MSILSAVLEAQNNCPLRKCIPCPHGFLLDESGCQTCKCRDPCAEITCREDGETCRLVVVSCIDTPCPPVPMCLPQPQNPCQMGQPLSAMGSTEAMVCGPTGSSCPLSHKCHLSPLGEYAVCCPKPSESPALRQMSVFVNYGKLNLYVSGG